MARACRNKFLNYGDTCVNQVWAIHFESMHRIVSEMRKYGHREILMALNNSWRELTGISPCSIQDAFLLSLNDPKLLSKHDTHEKIKWDPIPRLQFNK